jgi:2-polyprenyl-3-methyl-5-hydroxy-6-metoxy-1,4-benzoquinol methylase
MDNKINTGASHPVTNKIIFNLITKNISSNSRILDFGSGSGYMTQQIGQHLENNSLNISDMLFACEIAPENFLYSKTQCLKIEGNSKIPFDDNFFDLIYAIEVVEHMTRPYDYFVESFNKLKSGGTLIFSTPNISHFKSRLSFLFTGYHEMYGPLSTNHKNAGRISGHIMPLSINNFNYGLKKAGFESINFHIDKRKKSALIPAILFYPFLRFASYRVTKRMKNFDKEIYVENFESISFINSLDALSSRSTIIVAKKNS